MHTHKQYWYIYNGKGNLLVVVYMGSLVSVLFTGQSNIASCL